MVIYKGHFLTRLINRPYNIALFRAFEIGIVVDTTGPPFPVFWILLSRKHEFNHIWGQFQDIRQDLPSPTSIEAAAVSKALSHHLNLWCSAWSCPIPYPSNLYFTFYDFNIPSEF